MKIRPLSICGLKFLGLRCKISLTYDKSSTSYRGQRGLYLMGKPKKRTSHRRTGTRRSHLVIKLARAVNAKSPVKAFTTNKESGKKLA